MRRQQQEQIDLRAHTAPTLPPPDETDFAARAEQMQQHGWARRNAITPPPGSADPLDTSRPPHCHYRDD